MIPKEKFTTPENTWYALAEDSAGTMPQIWLSVPESAARGEVMMMRTVAPAGHPVEEYQGTITVERSETELILTSKITGTGPTKTVLEDMSPVEQLIGELASYSHAAKLDPAMALEGSDLYWKINSVKDKLDSFLAPHHGPVESFVERRDKTTGRGLHRMRRIGYIRNDHTLWLVEPYRVNGEYQIAEIAEADPTGRIFCLHCGPNRRQLVFKEMLPTPMTEDDRVRFMDLLEKTEQLLAAITEIRRITSDELIATDKALVTIEKRAAILGQKAFDMLAPREQ